METVIFETLPTPHLLLIIHNVTKYDVADLYLS